MHTVLVCQLVSPTDNDPIRGNLTNRLHATILFGRHQSLPEEVAYL
jgi:hypothetical protein